MSDHLQITGLCVIFFFFILCQILLQPQMVESKNIVIQFYFILIQNVRFCYTRKW